MSGGIAGFNSLQELAKAQARINELQRIFEDLYIKLLKGKQIDWEVKTK